MLEVAIGQAEGFDGVPCLPDGINRIVAGQLQLRPEGRESRCELVR